MLNDHYPTPAAAPTPVTLSKRIALQFKMFVPNVRRQVHVLRGRLILSAFIAMLVISLVVLINRIWQVPFTVLISRTA